MIGAVKMQLLALLEHSAVTASDAGSPDVELGTVKHVRRRRIAVRLLEGSSDPLWRSLINLYTATFEVQQRETPSQIQRNAYKPGTRDSGYLVLAAHQNGVCVGGIIFSLLSIVNCAYVDYIFVAQRRQEHGIGTRLVAEMKRYLSEGAAGALSAPLRGVFTEIQKIGECKAHLRRRLLFWTRLGVHPLRVAWYYPRMNRTARSVPMYLAYGSCGRRADGNRWYPSEFALAVRSIFASAYDQLPEALEARERALRAVKRLPRTTPIGYLAI